MTGKSGGQKVGVAAGKAGASTNASARLTTSHWHLRSYLQRRDHNYKGIDDILKGNHSFSVGQAAKNTASKHDVFDTQEDSKTRTVMVDGQEVIFELMEDVNMQPTESREARNRRTVQALNASPSPLEMRLRWWLFRYTLPQVTLLYLAVFLGMNFLFAGLWMIQDGKCCDDNELKYTEVFDFAIQTSTTIGYGGYVPQGYFSNFLVVMLSFITLLLNTVYGGVLFLKFVAPSAKIEFSDVITMSNVNGMPCLEFRIGNDDGQNNLLKDLNIRLSYSYFIEYTDESGHERNMGQTQELQLLHHNRSKLDEFVWTCRHVIDETSPLFGLNFQEFPGSSIYFFEVCLNATQEHTGAPVFCQTRYFLEDVMIGKRFVDQMSWDEHRTVVKIDFANMNKTVPYPVWYPRGAAAKDVVPEKPGAPAEGSEAVEEA